LKRDFVDILAISRGFSRVLPAPGEPVPMVGCCAGKARPGLFDIVKAGGGGRSPDAGIARRQRANPSEACRCRV